MKQQLTFGLTLVRHGETQYNKEGVLQGQAIDSSLSETGRVQAAAAGRYLEDVTFTNVFSSNMLRAKQTAETIMKLNSCCSGLIIESDPLLREISFGTAEGGRVQDVKDAARAAGETFPGFTPPGGETPAQVKVRVRRFLDDTLQRLGVQHWSREADDDHEAFGDTSTTTPPGDDVPDGVPDGVPGGVHVLVVGHGAFMCVMFRYFVEELKCSLPRGVDERHVFALSPNAGISRFVVDVTRNRDAFRVSRVRCLFVHRGEHVKQTI